MIDRFDWPTVTFPSARHGAVQLGVERSFGGKVSRRDVVAVDEPVVVDAEAVDPVGARDCKQVRYRRT